eukprot:CAMPEP_0117035796 /NCGR_PEP_ID=MMETSP0472-20121206/25401_1 /TAXON_ID=693140 ORGANISM="Tiarina fusus, Strain LIS" /NCGR_SAMPLE_ID=MMETSP0472 /ASSEMBLY_ACC=CAM_ASM_000603 /LENGTH=175 /DNA_ID=CAMNT_0004745373 /DNA_START=8 /DNA_END=531 /DNA_ORIENTATION=-
MPEYKLVVLGSGGVGKSALTIQFIQQRFIDEYDPTIEDCYRKQTTIDGKECVLNVLDTAGQEDFAAMRDAHIKQGQGFLCCYSITDRGSFNEVNTFRNQILRCKDADFVPMILVGTKSDLASSRVVTYDEGRNLASDYQCPVFETSAKEGANIEDTFFQAVREIKKYEKPSAKPS